MRALFSIKFASKKLLLPLAEKKLYSVFCIQNIKKEAGPVDEVTHIMLSVKYFTY